MAAAPDVLERSVDQIGDAVGQATTG